MRMRTCEAICVQATPEGDSPRRETSKAGARQNWLSGPSEEGRGNTNDRNPFAQGAR